MKRILTLLIAVLMLASTLVFSTSATGTLVFSDDFEEGFVPRNWITDRDSCLFEWDKYSRCIQGYDAARVLQSNYGGRFDKWWDSFYGKVDFQIRGFDDLPEQEGRTHSVGLWYRDRMDVAEGDQIGAVYTYYVEIETGRATLNKSHTWNYYDQYGILQEAKTDVLVAEGQINGTIEVGEDAPWYELGWRITSGKIECYFNQELVISAEADPDDPKYGLYTLNSVDESVGSKKSAFIVWNDGNWLALDNFEIWTPDYDFVIEDPIVYGDVNNDTAVNLSDVSMMLQYIAKWEIADFNEKAADVNDDDTVNLTDVSKMLQYIAKWEGVVLGPTA